MKIRQALIWGAKELKKFKSSAIDAEVLLLHCLKTTEELKNLKTEEQFTKSFLYTNPDFNLPPTIQKKFKSLIRKRAKGIPVAYLTHHQEFFGLDFYVDKSVLIPRPESELLVEKAIQIIKSYKLKAKKLNILDLGTGSGCIAVALAKNLQPTSYNLQAKFYASDISAKAIKIARKNAKKHKVFSKIRFIQSNLFLDILRRNFEQSSRSYKMLEIKFDLIIANLPYLDPKWIKGEIKYEPINALNGDKNGLDIIKKFLWQAKNHLRKDAAIIFEIDPRQKKSILKIVKNIYPDKKILLKKDLAGLDRIIIIR